MATFTMSVETDAGTYVHGFHFGTEEKIARQLVEGYFPTFRPKIGTRVITLALMRNGKLFDCYDGQWANDIQSNAYEDS